MKEILSDSTKKVKKSLLFIDSVAIVYWFLKLKVLKITLSGSETMITYPERIPTVIIALILYFLFLLLYYAYVDLKIWKSSVLLKPFEDRIRVHLTGINPSGKQSAHESIRGIQKEPDFILQESIIKKQLKLKYTIDLTIPLIVSAIAITVIFISI